MEASEHAARAASTSELAVCCLLCPSVAWIRTPTSDRQLTMPPTPLSSPDHAAKLDAEPLNPATGLTSTRALYEVPKCGPVGADGPAGTLSRPPDLSRGPPSGLAVETSCSRTLCRFGSDRQRDRLHGRQLARSLAPPGARDSQPRARRLVLPVRARPRSICPTHPLAADLCMFCSDAAPLSDTLITLMAGRGRTSTRPSPPAWPPSSGRRRPRLPARAR